MHLVLLSELPPWLGCTLQVLESKRPKKVLRKNGKVSCMGRDATSPESGRSSPGTCLHWELHNVATTRALCSRRLEHHTWTRSGEHHGEKWAESPALTFHGIEPEARRVLRKAHFDEADGPTAHGARPPGESPSRGRQSRGRPPCSFSARSYQAYPLAGPLPTRRCEYCCLTLVFGWFLSCHFGRTVSFIFE